jgi:hypothetical protein
MKLLRAFCAAVIPSAAGCGAMLSLVYLATGQLVPGVVAGIITAIAVVLIRLFCIEAEDNAT